MATNVEERSRSGRRSPPVVAGGGGVKLVLKLAFVAGVGLLLGLPMLKESREAKERDAGRARRESDFATLVRDYQTFDLKTAKKADPARALGRKGVIVQLGATQGLLHEPARELAGTPAEVGVVLLYRLVRDAEPSVEYEGGGKGYGTTVVTAAVTHPERELIGTTKKWFAAPKATVGVGVAGVSVASASISAIIPRDYLPGILERLVAPK